MARASDDTSERAPRPLLRVLDAVDRVLWRLHPVALVIVLVVYVAVVNGVTWTGNIDTILVIVHHPLSPRLSGIGSFVLASPLGPLVAHAIGARTRTSFAAMHLVLVAAGVIVAVVAMQRRAGRLAAQAVAVAIACGPLGRVLLTWLGEGDPVSVLCGIVLALSSNVWFAAAAALVVGFNHTEIGAVMIASLVLLDGANGWTLRRPREHATIAGALLAGRALLAAYFVAAHVPAGAGREQFLSRVGFSGVAHPFFDGGVLLVLSLYAAWWIATVWILATMRQRAPKVFIAMLTVQVGLFVVTILTLDETRIFTIAAWTSTLWAIQWITMHADEIAWRRVIAACALVGVLVPIRLDYQEGHRRARQVNVVAAAPGLGSTLTRDGGGRPRGTRASRRPRH